MHFYVTSPPMRFFPPRYFRLHAHPLCLVVLWLNDPRMGSVVGAQWSFFSVHSGEKPINLSPSLEPANQPSYYRLKNVFH